MDLKRIKAMLQCHGNDCLRLADRLTKNEGLDICQQEKDLIRLAVMPVVKESSYFLQSAFVLNDIKAYEHSLNAIEDLFQQLK